MERRPAILCVVAATAASACGTLLAASDDDPPPSEQKDAGNSADGAVDGGDGSAMDAVANADAADAADAPLSKSDAYRAAVMADGPIAYWRFAEPDGALNYSSETNMHAAVPGSGTKAPSLAVPGIFGQSSQSLFFDGIDVGVHATVPTLPFLDDTFTFEAWIQLATALDGNFRHLFNHSNGSVSYGIYLRGAEGLVIERIQNGNKQQIKSQAVTSAGWHHVVATRDTLLHLYVDGDEKTPIETYGTNPAPSGVFFLGAKNGSEPSVPTNTRVAEAAVYLTALPKARVVEHWTLGKP